VTTDPEGADESTDPGSEPVEVVDADGRVVDIVDRRRMRADRLRHRCTYIVVLAGDDVVVHRRAEWKDVWPGRWDLAFGGVCGVGEDWEPAARRELREEAGVDADLVSLGAVAYDDPEVHLVGRAFLARHPGPFTFPDGEVVEHRLVPAATVFDWIRSRPHTPDSVTVLDTLTGGDLRPRSDERSGGSDRS
jgi:8-oxo-dGTP pyrophosphatase MutT (NUDIX family)